MNIRVKIYSESLTDFAGEDERFPGIIYLENETECYPNGEWVDNVIILLRWWMHSISETLKGREGQGISFMEGPYYLNVTRENDDIVLETDDGEVNWRVNLKGFSKDLLSASNYVARELRQKEYNDLAVKLEDASRELREALTA